MTRQIIGQFKRDRRASPLTLTRREPGAAALRAAEPRVVQVEPQLLQSYVGQYSFTDGQTVTITLEGQQLFSQWSYQPKLPIYAASDNRFFWRQWEGEIRFERAPSGEVNSLVAIKNGRSMSGTRLLLS